MCIFSLNSCDASLNLQMANLFYYKYYNKQIIVSLPLLERGNKQQPENFVREGPTLTSFFS